MCVCVGGGGGVNPESKAAPHRHFNTKPIPLAYTTDQTDHTAEVGLPSGTLIFNRDHPEVAGRCSLM